jgi:hypothetical protein
MNKHSVTLAIALLGGASVPATAQFGFDLPADSGTSLQFAGDPNSATNGIMGFHWLATGQVDSGHLVEGVIQNAPVSGFPSPYRYRADYYIADYGHGPYSGSEFDPAARSTGHQNMVNFDAAMVNNGMNYNDISFYFGPAEGQPLTSTWNLGTDTLGVEWFGDLNSPLEERIYSANPAEVVVGLSVLGTPFITFGYSDLYEIINYGATTATNDDTIQAYSDPVLAYAADELGAIQQELADAFLADVALGGGAVQLRFDTVQPASYIAGPGMDWVVAEYSFGGSVQVVSAVPEPETYAGIFSLLIGGFVWMRRRRGLIRNAP